MVVVYMIYNLVLLFLLLFWCIINEQWMVESNKSLNTLSN